jgi:hypothetical protein
MIGITKNFSNEILNLINNKIASAQILTDQSTRNVLIVNKAIIDNSEANELVLNIELYRSDEVSETLTEIRFYDNSGNLILNSTSLNVNLPGSKVSFIYQIKLVYSA